MTTGIHQVEANLPIHHVWLFVRELNNWAPLIPGYLEHKMVSERQSTWKFTGDAGFIKKTVHMSLDITEWNRPTKITFDLVGLNEKFVGKGYFEATSLSEQKTRITGCLRITAKGMMGPMINSVLKTIIPKVTREFTTAVALEMTQVEKMPT
ncbi:MAG TPA: SRPBCC family protein [Virgibacillus sp.]|nr:SRPBCC family protein [Virgibacillus sp.]